jgi:uncharacterized phiE125 gp8 family phage protein
MWYPPTVTTPPAAEPVTLEQAKMHLRCDDRDGEGVLIARPDDDLISSIIEAARDHVEKYCNARWAEQTLVCQCDSFSDFARLPEGPLKSVTSVGYVDAAGDTQTLDAAIYEARKGGLEPSIGLQSGRSWPVTRPGSRITLTAVFGGDVPKAVRQAILLFVGAWYENREESVIGTITSQLPASVTVDALLCNYRRGI